MKHKSSLYTVLLVMLAAIFGSGNAIAQKAYTEYDSETKTLTFYYDDNRSTRTGTTFSIVEGEYTPLWNSVYDGPSAEVTTVVFDPSFADARPTTTFSWFAQMANLKTITGMKENLNTSEVTSMDRMFRDCTSLTSIDLSSFDTKKVENMYAMFGGCQALEELNLESFDTQSLTDAESMFRGCNALTTIYINTLTWKMSGVANSKDMFDECIMLMGCRGSAYDGSHTDKAYAHLDFGSVDPGYLSVTPEPYALYDSSNTLTFFYDLDRATRVGQTFDLPTDATYPEWVDTYSSSINDVEFAPSFAKARPTSTAYWFSGMNSLNMISGLENLNTSEVTSMAGMFQYCSMLTDLFLDKFDTRNVTDMSDMFRGLGMPELDLTGFNTRNAANIARMFNSSSLNKITVGPEWSTENVVNSDDMFTNCHSLIGGNGTAYSAEHVDASYARFDLGEDSPGYLTGNFEAYTELSDGALTFYYDLNRGKRNGITFNLNTDATAPAWSAFSEDVTKATFDPSFAYTRPVVTYHWFSQMSNLQEIEGLENLNTSEVTDMTGMFSGCNSLSTLDVTHFNTHNVTSMQEMFKGLAVTSLDLGNFYTGNVTQMTSMFQDCSALQTIYAGDVWSTYSATDTDNMFDGCTSLVGEKGTAYDACFTDNTYARIDGGEEDPGYLSYMGVYAVLGTDGTLTYYNDGLRSQREGKVYEVGGGIVPAWNTMSDHGYQSIKAAVVDPSMASARPTSTRLWFASLNVSEIQGLEYINTSEVTDMFAMFKGSAIPSLDLSHFDTRKVTSMDDMFSNCTKLTELDLSNFDTRNVTNMDAMFQFCSNMTNIDLSNFNTENVTNMQSMFRGCESLQEIDLYNFNTAKVKNIGFMFRECTALTTILVGDEWSTMSVADDDFMFTDCSNLVGGMGTTYDEDQVGIGYAHVDEGDSNPGYLTKKEAYAIFADKTLSFYFDGKRNNRTGTGYDISGIGWYYDNNNKKVTTVTFDPSFAVFRPAKTADWFNNMTHLTAINGLENLNTSEATNMSFMFANCEALTALDLSTLNTSKVTDMSYMFYSSTFSVLETLDLSDFNTTKVTDVESMFDGCSELKTITVGDGWNVDKANSNNMFADCTSLVGEKGTTYDASYTDNTYARIDGGEENPGYLSAADKRIPGDVNGDGYVNSADVVAIYNYIIDGEASGFTKAAADVDGNGIINSADVVRVYNIIINGE